VLMIFTGKFPVVIMFGNCIVFQLFTNARFHPLAPNKLSGVESLLEIFN
jgi:hypothetical protein